MGLSMPSGSEKNVSNGAAADVKSMIEFGFDAAAGSSKKNSTTASRSSMYILSDPAGVTRSRVPLLQMLGEFDTLMGARRV
jgi:hypothetical protein